MNGRNFNSKDNGDQREASALRDEVCYLHFKLCTEQFNTIIISICHSKTLELIFFFVVSIFGCCF